MNSDSFHSIWIVPLKNTFQINGRWDAPNTHESVLPFVVRLTHSQRGPHPRMSHSGHTIPLGSWYNSPHDE